IDGKLVDTARFLGLRVGVGVSAADKPENRRGVPLGTERPEVLARGCRSGLPNPVGGEVTAKRIDDTRARLFVIHIQRIAVQWSYLRWPRGTRCRGLSVDNPFDGRKHAFAHASVECAYVELDDRLVGYNVFLSAGL